MSSSEPLGTRTKAFTAKPLALESLIGCASEKPIIEAVQPLPSLIVMPEPPRSEDVTDTDLMLAISMVYARQVRETEPVRTYKLRPCAAGRRIGRRC